MIHALLLGYKNEKESEMSGVFVEAVGTVRGYEDYHNAIWLHGGLLGESHYDKNQRKHIAVIRLDGKQKRFYHDTPNGIKRSIDKWLDKIQS